MKTIKLIRIICLTFIFVSCGSSERVITDGGKVYTVDGNTIKNNGIEVTEDLSSDQKNKIRGLLEDKKEARKTFENKKEELEDAIAEQERIQNEARQKEKELKNRLDALEDEFAKMQDVKDSYASIKTRYADEKRKFNRLKKSGELSPNDIKDWKEKLKKLKRKVAEAKAKMNKI